MLRCSRSGTPADQWLQMNRSKKLKMLGTCCLVIYCAGGQIELQSLGRAKSSHLAKLPNGRATVTPNILFKQATVLSYSHHPTRLLVTDLFPTSNNTKKWTRFVCPENHEWNYLISGEHGKTMIRILSSMFSQSWYTVFLCKLDTFNLQLQEPQLVSMIQLQARVMRSHK